MVHDGFQLVPLAEQAGLCRSLTTATRRRLGPVEAYPDAMSTVDLSDEVVREFVAEFGEAAPQVAEKALRSEITRHRIERAVKDGTDPAAAVAEALAKDPEFVAEVERLDVAGEQPAGDLEARLRRSAG